MAMPFMMRAACSTLMLLDILHLRQEQLVGRQMWEEKAFWRLPILLPCLRLRATSCFRQRSIRSYDSRTTPPWGLVARDLVLLLLQLKPPSLPLTTLASAGQMLVIRFLRGRWRQITSAPARISGPLT